MVEIENSGGVIIAVPESVVKAFLSNGWRVYRNKNKKKKGEK